ncbi:holin-like protein [Volucribacter psittacicida]|uniref:Holin-like protein n=1 Tax=Volucribacter psittacicida TaxID=203482 RepID=A0A4V2PBR2_9PAST|nr:CidA/LrgA family protein [Volucribacter psittacicida]TCJ98375.1 holin-like protein [Volucribacter psittacicida]
MKRKILDLCRSLAILYLMFFLGKAIAYLVPIGVPASIWGLLLLFMALCLKIIQLDWLYFGAGLFIRYMALLFIPVSVGVIKYSDLLFSQAKALLIPNIVSTIITLIFIGLFSDYVFSRTSFKHLRKKVLKRRLKLTAK